MRPFAIIVDFRLKPGTFERFKTLIVANAEASVRHEPGCQRFDVVVPPEDPDRVVLYEIYDDRAAFEAHTRTAHFAEFDRVSRPMVAAKSVSEYTVAFVGAKEPA